MPHPAVDWLYPLLQAVQGVEESLVPPTSHLPWSSRLAEQVRSAGVVPRLLHGRSVRALFD